MEADSVDLVVEGWAREAPKMETSALAITGRLDRIARHLDRRATEAMNESGLSCRDLDVLGALRRSGSLPAGQLARAAMLSSGGMTGEADRLARAGLIVRRPDPEDRRTVLIGLTPQGAGVAENALKAYLGAGEQALSVLSDDERETLSELLHKLLVGLEGCSMRDVEVDEGASGRQTKAQPSRPKSRFQAE